MHFSRNIILHHFKAYKMYFTIFFYQLPSIVNGQTKNFFHHRYRSIVYLCVLFVFYKSLLTYPYNIRRVYIYILSSDLTNKRYLFSPEIYVTPCFIQWSTSNETLGHYTTQT
jgi:hypothetical protein